MSLAHIGIGSNIQPHRYVPWAIQRLAEDFVVLRRSSVYETAPIDRPEQDPYWNAIVVIEVDESVEALATTLRALESNAGRTRTADRYASRTLDLDILLWDGDAPNEDARGDLERPWNRWAIHRLGDGPKPDGQEPSAVG